MLASFFMAPMPGPAPHVARLITASVTVVAVALSSLPHAVDSPRPLYTAPVSPVVVARLFDPPPQPWNAGHRGIDLASEPGHEVRAPGAGVVTFAGTVVDRGVVTVLHANGLRSSLEPVDPAVEIGERVTAHQVVGHVQADVAHCAPAHCVHWGLRDGERYLNPLDWLVGFGPVRLLPLREPRTRNRQRGTPTRTRTRGSGATETLRS